MLRNGGGRSEEHCCISGDTELVVRTLRHHLPHPKGQQGAWPQSRAQQESFCLPGHHAAQGRPVRARSEHAALLLGIAPSVLRALLVGHPGKGRTRAAAPAQREDRCCPAVLHRSWAGLVCGHGNRCIQRNSCFHRRGQKTSVLQLCLRVRQFCFVIRQ